MRRSSRVRKFFLREGRQLLYGKNTFEFDLDSSAYIQRRSVRHMNPRGDIHSAHASMPGFREPPAPAKVLDEGMEDEAIQKEIREMGNAKYPEDLPD